MLTTIAAYGSFILAERIHVSPVIAVLLTGMIIGNYGRRQGMSPNTEVAVDSFWEYPAFVVNSLVFLLIGIEIQFSMLANHGVHPLGDCGDDLNQSNNDLRGFLDHQSTYRACFFPLAAHRVLGWVARIALHRPRLEPSV